MFQTFNNSKSPYLPYAQFSMFLAIAAVSTLITIFVADAQGQDIRTGRKSFAVFCAALALITGVSAAASGYFFAKSRAPTKEAESLLQQAEEAAFAAS